MSAEEAEVEVGTWVAVETEAAAVDTWVVWVEEEDILKLRFRLFFLLRS